MRDMNENSKKVKCIWIFLSLSLIGIGSMYELKKTTNARALLIAEDNKDKDDHYSESREKEAQNENNVIKNDVNLLTIEAIAYRPDELVFSISKDDFVDSYDRVYLEDNESAYFLDAFAWRLQIEESGIHSPYKTHCFHFTEDETIWSMPTLDVYMTEDEAYIQEISLNFDEHSFQPSMYEKYEKMCFYTLKVFFPDLSEGKIKALYTKINELARDNMLPHDQGYHEGIAPKALFYRKGVGVYPYFAAGECVHLCIMPVTTEIIENYEREGVEIHEIQ